ncbi:MAG: hypothetical protein ACOC0V_03180 [Oceanicaulis sp.]
MSVDAETACARLRVDRFGLERLIALGEIAAVRSGEGWTIAAPDLDAAAARLARRRAQALTALAKMDGPHL